jgi:AAA domain, putative AbiEii toxin, Type IV TA system
VTKKHEPTMSVQLNRIKDEWRAAAGDARALRGETAEVLAAELRRVEDERNSATGRIVDEKTELAQRDNDLDELRAQINILQNEQAKAVAALSKWLDERGARSIPDYREKAKEALSRDQKLREHIEQRSDLVLKWKCADAAALKSECISRIETLEKKITDGRLPDPDVKLKEREIDTLRKGLEEKQSQHVRMVQQVSESKGVVKGSLAGIPEQIVQAERRVNELEGQIAEIDLMRQASQQAAEIFGEIERDAGAIFFDLTKDIGALFGEILPETREIAIKDLGDGSITVKDAGGAPRALDDLSQGTRDSFLFAARLALSVRAAPEGGLLLLDEPFLSLDADREDRALRMLKSFQEKEGRQIIIFGKEKNLTERLRRLFPDLVVHNLES